MTNLVTPPEAVASLLNAALPGQDSLDCQALLALREATHQLVVASGDDGRSAYERFLEVSARSIAIDFEQLGRHHGGRVVLVTGGTGCIGSEVVRLVNELGPARVISVSRGIERKWPRYAGVDYQYVDIRDLPALTELICREKPDIVYHLAAQHDPGLAEVEVERTISTNVGGTINVVEACKRLGTVRLACASTGKALRPFSPDIYCGSKKVAEWILGDAAASTSMKITAVRFTHVVDNSIILRRLRNWTDAGETIRLHSFETMFYLQSALEAAQLLVSSVLDAVPGRLSIGAIRDLGWPVSLLDLAVGMVASQPTQSAIYCRGIEAGYECAPYPGLYDPKVSGLISPLFNALEAFCVTGAKSSMDVDVFYSVVRPSGSIRRLINSLVARASAPAKAGTLRDLIVQCGWAMLEAYLAGAPVDVIDRHITLLTGKFDLPFSEDDLTTKKLVEREQARRTWDCPVQARPTVVSRTGGSLIGVITH